MKRFLFVVLVLGLFVPYKASADWPQFRADAARSGYTAESLPADLHLSWVYRPSHAPEPAWTGDDTRMPFDYANAAVTTRGFVLFGSSTDDKVYALDGATGEPRWEFFTESPVRFAPAVWKDRVFVAGDDGWLYCLALQTGKLIWKRSGGPAVDTLLGNGRIISRWPARGAPVVLEDKVYFAAGIWPTEGIFLYALDASDGSILWLNDSSGSLEINQPHPGARAKSGISAQGYLAAAGDTLLVPTGRAMPAAFDRAKGNYRYFHLQEQGAGWGARKGAGPYVSIIDGKTFNENDVFQTTDGEFLARGIPSMAMAAFPEHIVFAADAEIRAIPRSNLLVEREVVNRKGKKVKKLFLGEPAWAIPCPEQTPVSLIGAGGTVVLGDQNGKVITASLESKAIVSRLEVEGLPLDLAVSDGRLYVSTDRGSIYCFEAKKDNPPRILQPQRESVPDAGDSVYSAAAEEILRKSGIREGYCLDLGCGDGRLAQELARQSALKIYAVDSDASRVAAARKRLDDAGWYGHRVTVLQRELSDTKLPNFFANLIVSSRSLEEGPAVVPGEERWRMQRPYGGVACLGKLGEMTCSKRGPLDQVGQWTHQYCDPANTNCSPDGMLRAPLNMLWFTDNDFEMPSRHGRGPAPLFAEGLLYIEGMHGIRAIDAYNGWVHWEYPIKDVLKSYDQEHLNGTAITGSNWCLSDGSLYVRFADRCLRLDATTGSKLGEFPAPRRADGTVGTWGYLACENDTLYGSLCNEEHVVWYTFGRADMSEQFSESTLFFALNAKTGELKWTFTPEHSIRHNAVAVGGDRVSLIDRPLAIRDRRKGDQTEHPPGELLALDSNTGEVLWRAAERVDGTLLALSVPHDVLFMSYQSTRFRLSSEKGGRMAAFRASDGKPLWNIEAKYASRPILNDRTLYAEPAAWDLLTGQKKEFHFTRSYGCGTLSGSTHLVAFRSATLGYLDLLQDGETENYGGIRPGCWINTIPAGGLLLMPDATARCTCSYLIKATVALQPADGSARPAVKKRPADRL